MMITLVVLICFNIFITPNLITSPRPEPRRHHHNQHNTINHPEFSTSSSSHDKPQSQIHTPQQPNITSPLLRPPTNTTHPLCPPPLSPFYLTLPHLPSWTKYYLQWHANQRCLSSSTTTRYLIATCLPSYSKCGGLSDRLKPLAYYLLYANRTNRVLLFHWEKPHMLEHFLSVPSDGGMDWRVPAELLPIVKKVKPPSGDGRQALHWKDERRIILGTLQSADGAKDYFESHAPDGTGAFEEVFGDMYRAVFTPVDAVQREIRNVMNGRGLVPGGYVSAHVRVRHGKTGGEGRLLDVDKDGGLELIGKGRERVMKWAVNAVECVRGLDPVAGRVVYFASDAHEVTNEMISSGMEETEGVVVGVQHETEPRHLDTNDWRETTPADFYPAFVDLYVMAMGRCISYDVGGYATFARLLSDNFTCAVRHRTKRGVNMCHTT